MKKIVLLVLFLAAAGCASDATRHITVETEPADADITVVSGKEGIRRTYRSPADIAMADPSLKNPMRLEISKERYRTKTIDLASVAQEHILVRLDKLVHYRLRYRMISPIVSDELTFHDKTLAVRVEPGERDIQVSVQNLSSKPLKISWDLADYTDQNHRTHRVMPASMNPQDRGNTVPPQHVPPGATVEQRIVPRDGFAYETETRTYSAKLLLPVDSEAALNLKGKTIGLFLPVEQGGGIIPSYNIKLQITDVTQDQ